MCRLRAREGQANRVTWLGSDGAPALRHIVLYAMFIHSYCYSSKTCCTCYVQGTRPKNAGPYGDKASITLSSWSVQNNQLSTTITNLHTSLQGVGKSGKPKDHNPAPERFGGRDGCSRRLWCLRLTSPVPRPGSTTPSRDPARQAPPSLGFSRHNTVQLFRGRN